MKDTQCPHMRLITPDCSKAGFQAHGLQLAATAAPDVHKVFPAVPAPLSMMRLVLSYMHAGVTHVCIRSQDALRTATRSVPTIRCNMQYLLAGDSLLAERLTCRHMTRLDSSRLATCTAQGTCGPSEVPQPGRGASKCSMGLISQSSAALIQEEILGALRPGESVHSCENASSASSRTGDETVSQEIPNRDNHRMRTRNALEDAKTPHAQITRCRVSYSYHLVARRTSDDPNVEQHAPTDPQVLPGKQSILHFQLQYVSLSCCGCGPAKEHPR